MHYKKNYLNNVVLRLDFDALAPLAENKNVDSKLEFSTRIAKIYPIVVGQPTTTLSVNIGPAGTGVNQQVTSIQWQHRKSEKGTSVVALAPEFIAIECGKDDYDHFPAFRAEVGLTLDAFLALYQPPVFNRIGLRYINEVNIPEGNPLDWDSLLAPSLVTSAMACASKDVDMVRSMHQLTVRRDQSTMVFNYGLFNSDFPNTLARRAFVLDYDCSRTAVPQNEAFQVIDELNKFCETMFEASIEDGLRKLLGVIDG